MRRHTLLLVRTETKKKGTGSAGREGVGVIPLLRALTQASFK